MPDKRSFSPSPLAGEPHLPAPRRQPEAPRPRRRLSTPLPDLSLRSRESRRGGGGSGIGRHEPDGQLVRHDDEGGLPSDSRPDLPTPVAIGAADAAGFRAADDTEVRARARRDSPVSAASRRGPPAESEVVLRVRDVRHRIERQLQRGEPLEGWGGVGGTGARDRVRRHGGEKNGVRFAKKQTFVDTQTNENSKNRKEAFGTTCVCITAVLKNQPHARKWDFG